MTHADISVVLPVHRGVVPAHLERALRSIAEQTALPREVILVEDGPLDSGHDLAIRRVRLPGLKRIRLEVNQGAGVANQAGLEAASSTWIAKCDADDVNVPDRFERQFAVVTETGAELCGSAMLEFVGAESDVRNYRATPLTHEAIVRRLPVNNPINHPTAFFNREVALRVGGYPEWRYMQDYGLFMRLVFGGARMVNLPEPLVLFRSGEQFTRRRRSTGVRQCERHVQRSLHELGFVSAPRMWFNLAWRLAFRRLPAPILALVYKRMLSQSASPHRDLSRRKMRGAIPAASPPERSTNFQ
ncbi:glycosyltransferase [Nocardioides bigeumensis]|uniref:Glycosyltransferase n=1 Tax=Nocardioides bigeumensis TaxID=433657 RepID=A0ABN2XRV7_9ACTN